MERGAIIERINENVEVLRRGAVHEKLSVRCFDAARSGRRVLKGRDVTLRVSFSEAADP